MVARRLRTCLLLTLLALPMAAQSASACPLCKESAANTGSDGSSPSDGTSSAGVASGFNTSIYLMLASFVGVLGFVGFTLYRGAQGVEMRPTSSGRSGTGT